MSYRTFGCAIAALLGIVLLSAAPADATPRSYTLIDITGVHADGAVAYAINNNGTIVGSASFSAVCSGAFTYDLPTGSLTNLASNFGCTSIAYDVNDAGQITGWGYSGGRAVQPGIYHNSVFTPIELPGIGTEEGIALAMNVHGEVVGGTTYPDGRLEAYAFHYRQGEAVNLGTLGGLESSASAINDHGTIVGSSKRSVGSNPHAFVYQNGQMHDLGSLGGFYDYSMALDINNAGQIVGAATEPEEGYLRAVAFVGNSIEVLGTLGGEMVEVNSEALAINDGGDIVGRSGIGPDYIWPHGFIYADGEMRDLNDLITDSLGLVVTEAWDINNAGFIVGSARTIDNKSRAVLLVPIPEPSSGLLAGVALIVGLAAMKSSVRRRSRC